MIDENKRPGRSGNYHASDRSARLIYLERAMSASSKPSLLINDRELGVLRRSIGKDGWKRSLYLQPTPLHRGLYVGAGLLSVANQWLEADVAGQNELDNLFCLCGNKLHVSQDGIVCVQCGRHFAEDEMGRTVRMLRFNGLAAGAVALALVYGIEKDKAYAEKSAEILKLCAELYRGLHEVHEPSNAKKNAYEARWAIAMAQACDLIYYSRCVSEEDRSEIEKDLLAQVAEDLASRVLIGCEDAWRISALGVIGLFLKESQFLELALTDARTWMLSNIGSDGLLSDSSMAGHFDALDALMHLNEACQRCGLDPYGVDPYYDKGLRRMFSAPICCAYPSLRLPAVGSSIYELFLPLDLYEVAFRRWSNPEYAWVLRRGYGYGEAPLNSDQAENHDHFSRSRMYAFLFGRELSGRLTAYMPKSDILESQGLCCIRNGISIMATINYGDRRDDDHLDMFSFTLYMKDQLLSPDYGVPADPAENITRCSETCAHNAVVVDGTSQRNAFSTASITTFFESDFQGAEFVCDECYPGVTHTRKILVVGELCLVFDELKSDEEHCYDWLLRCEAKPIFPDGLIHPETVDVYHPHLELAGSCTSNQPFIMSRKCDKGEMQQVIWSGPGEAEYMLGTCHGFATPIPMPTMICRQRGFDAIFVSAFSSGTDADIKMTGCTLTLTSGEIVDYFYSHSCTEGTGGAISTDASFVAIRTRRGVVQALVMVKGSYCELNEEIVIKCPSEAQCVEIATDERGQRMSYKGGKPGAVLLKTSARTVRVNGHRAAAAGKGGIARLHIAPAMLETKVSETS